MTVPVQTPNNSYVGDGANDTFAFTFRILQNSDLTVFVDDVLQAEITDYTIENLTELGGDVVFEVGSIPPNNDVVDLIRDTSLDQETAYNPFDPFPADAHETALDKLTLVVQDQDERITESNLISSGHIQDFDDHVADDDIHYSDAPADNDPYLRQDNSWISPTGAVDSQWLRLDGVNSPMTGPLGTQDVVPTGDADNRDVGKDDNRFRRMFGKIGVFIGGDAALDLTLPADSTTGGLVAGNEIGAGDTKHIFGSGANTPSALVGKARATPGNFATLESTAESAQCFGTAVATGPSSAGIGLVSAQGYASFIFGHAYSFAGGDAQVLASESNSVVIGRAYAAYGAGVTALIEATDRGSIAIGRAHALNSSISVISSSGRGSLAFGRSYGFTNSSSRIDAKLRTHGSIVGGSSISYELGSISEISADDGPSGEGYGSICFGSVRSSDGYTATIKTDNEGAFAHGVSVGYTGNANILASGAGSFAHGASINGAGDIIASADNSAQFGVGTNSEADSLQVGTQVRLKGTVGAPAAPGAGDIWVDGQLHIGEDGGAGINVENLVPRSSLAAIGGPNLTDRWDSIFGRIGILLGGDSAVLDVQFPSSASDGGILAGSQNGPGTSRHIFGDPYRSLLLIGNTTAGQLDHTAEAECSGGSSILIGSSFASGPNTNPSDARVKSTGYGSSVLGGYAYAFGGGTCLTQATGSTSIAMGRAYAGGVGSDSTLEAIEGGSLAFGRPSASNGGTALVSAGGRAGLVIGRAYGTVGTAQILSRQFNGGCFVGGSASSEAAGSLGEIGSYGTSTYGSIAFGSTYADLGFDAVIRVDGNGSFAMGQCTGVAADSLILAEGIGAFAHGYAIDGQDIIASANNSAQWGPGTNNQINSVSVGTGPRFKGTDGAPTTPRNGDFWVDGVNVFIQSGGVAVQIS